MTASRTSLALAAALALTLAVAARAQDSGEVGAPISIVPVQPATGQASGTFGATTIVPEVETTAAQPIETEAFGTLGEADGGFAEDIWAGGDRAVLEALIARLAPVPGSPVLNDLTARVLLSAAPPPGGAGTVHWLALRLDRLVALGRAPEAVPGTFSDETVARAARLGRFHALLGRGDDIAACAEARAAIQGDDAPLWPRALIYCQVSEGQSDAALFGLDVLTADATPTPASFAPLVRRLAVGEGVDVESFDDATIVEAALARAAGLAPEGSNDPWVLATLARVSGSPDAGQLALAERAEAVGAVSAATLADLYGAVAFTPADLEAPVEAAGALDGPMARALLYQAARDRPNPLARAEAIEAALTAAGSAYAVATRAFAPLIATLTPDETLVWFAPTAVRALIVADRAAAALAWWRLAQGRDAAVDAAIEPLWPLARLAELDAGEGGRERLVLWWRRVIVEDDVAARERAALAAALLLALDDGAGAGILPEVADERPAGAAPVALLAALDAAALAGRRGETVVLAALAAAEGGPEAAPAVVLTTIVRGLWRAGFEDEARRFAIEAAVAHGL